ncbi:MAG TPA: thioesterase family protein [Burkholderiaceae bacterium]|nr:thioesterase family protein [Burkholderiaceae bacterium]
MALRDLPWRRPEQTFHHTIDIYLKDSNAYTNTYFSRYFEWQGICRERWFHQRISSDMLQSQGVFVTKVAHQDYAHETFPFQSVDCQLNAFDVKQCSFFLQFRFYVRGRLVSSGYQQIVFTNRDKRIIRLPGEVLEKIRRYELPVSPLAG